MSLVEEWRPVVGYEGIYEVSTLGRVRSLARFVRRSDGVLCPVKERIRKPVLHHRGYLIVLLRKEGSAATKQIHQLVLEAFVGPSNGLQTRHLDGNRTNNKLENLCYGTSRENTDDRIRHGTCLKGEQHGRAKLTLEDVNFILQNPDIKGTELAKRFGVNYRTISSVRNGVNWSWLHA